MKKTLLTLTLFAAVFYGISQTATMTVLNPNVPITGNGNGLTNLNPNFTTSTFNWSAWNGTSIVGDDNAQTITLTADNEIFLNGDITLGDGVTISGDIIAANSILNVLQIGSSTCYRNTDGNYVITGTNWVGGLNTLPASSLDSSAMPNATIAAITTTNLNFMLIATNFLSNQLYTNDYGAPIQVTANAVLTPAAVAGGVAEAIRVRALTSNGGATNTSGLQTTILSIVMNYTNVLTAYVPTNAIYCFTNLSTGTGNSASVQGGQIFVY